MRQMVIAAWLLGSLCATPLLAQELPSATARVNLPVEQPRPVSQAILPTPILEPTLDQLAASEPPACHTVWGLVGLRAIFSGPRTAPNGMLYHPNFSMDLNFNFWIWRSQRLYLFGDIRLWGERSEYGVTNARDGILATSTP